MASSWLQINSVNYSEGMVVPFEGVYSLDLAAVVLSKPDCAISNTVMLRHDSFYGQAQQQVEADIPESSSVTNASYTAYFESFPGKFETETKLTLKFKAAYNTVDPNLKSWRSAY